MEGTKASSSKDERSWAPLPNDPLAHLAPGNHPFGSPDKPTSESHSVSTGGEISRQSELPAHNHENLRPLPLTHNPTQTPGNRVGILRNAAPPNTAQQSTNSPSFASEMQAQGAVDPSDLRLRLCTLPTSVTSISQDANTVLPLTDECPPTGRASLSFSFVPSIERVTASPAVSPESAGVESNIEQAVAPDSMDIAPVQLESNCGLTSVDPATSSSKSRSGTFSEFGSSSRAQLLERRPRHDSQPDPLLIDISITPPTPVNDEVNCQDDAEVTRNSSFESSVQNYRCAPSWFSTLRRKERVKAPADDDPFRGRLSRKDPAIEAVNKYHDEKRRAKKKNKRKNFQGSGSHSRQTSGVLGDSLVDDQGAQLDGNCQSPARVKNENIRFKAFFKRRDDENGRADQVQDGGDGSPTSKSKKVNGQLKGKSSTTLVDATNLTANDAEEENIEDAQSPEENAEDGQSPEETKSLDTLPRRLAKKISEHFKAMTSPNNEKERAASEENAEADQACVGQLPVSSNKNSVRRAAFKKKVSNLFRRKREESPVRAAPPLLQGEPLPPLDMLGDNAILALMNQGRLPSLPRAPDDMFAIPSNVPRSYR